MDRVRAVARQDAERVDGLWIAGKGSETSSIGIEAEALRVGDAFVNRS